MRLAYCQITLNTKTPAMNNVYTIKDLENLTGIKAHTIRIWEKRYKLIVPKRTDTNIRLYTEFQLQKLIYISLLNKNGYKISKLAKLDEDQLLSKVKEFSESNSGKETIIEELIISLVQADENNFNALLDSAIFNKGFEETIISIVYPFLEKVGQLWLSGSITPSQEHLVSNHIRNKLIFKINLLENVINPEAKTYLLFLPENEMHELGLLFAQYLLKKQGHNVIYLGQRIPLSDLNRFANLRNFDIIFTAIIHTLTNYKLQLYFDKLSKMFPDKQIYVSGNLEFLSSLKRPKNVSIIKSPYEILEV